MSWNNASNNLSLTMEQEFIHKRHCDEIDACDDIAALKDLLKSMIKSQMLKDNYFKQLMKGAILD